MTITEADVKNAVANAIKPHEEYWSDTDTERVIVWVGERMEPGEFSATYGSWCSPGTFGSTYGKWEVQDDKINITFDPEDE